MKQVDILPPYCYPIDGITVDQKQLYDSIITLLNRLRLDINSICSKPGFAINLNAAATAGKPSSSAIFANSG